MARLLYQGHGSFRLQSDAGMVIYVDPYVGEGYDLPANLILVTHQHGDHNRVELPAKAPGCTVITEHDILKDGSYATLTIGECRVRGVPAYNRNHDRSCCVGYLITLDGKTIYAAGDTSKIPEMAELSALSLDVALLPADGIYNMDLEEAAACAAIIGAKQTIPIHLKPGALFDRARAEQFDCATRRIVEPGEEITL